MSSSVRTGRRTFPCAHGGRHEIRRLTTILGLAAALALSGGAVATAQPGSSYAPGTEGLDPALATAYTLAADEAAAQGVTLWITSGYRTPAEQQAMWDNGVATYGSPEAARRWVLPPEESNHVAGHAIDVGPMSGAAWLEANGNRWGLCRGFVNEWWHFEIATLPGMPCPPMVPDATYPTPKAW